MKIDKKKLKQKIIDNRFRIGAVCGALSGIIGMVAAEYYRREYNSLLLDIRPKVELDDDWASIDVPREYLDDVYDNGAILKVRGKKHGKNSLTQTTTGEGFSEEANKRFDDFPFTDC